MRTVISSTTIKWSSGGRWIEAFVGVHYLVYSVLPEHTHETSYEHGALCQLGLIGSQVLIEITLGELLEPYVTNQNAESNFSLKKFQDTNFSKLRDKWISALTNYSNLNPNDTPFEPFISAEKLLKLRNGSAHKSSDVVTVEMARSALFTAVETSKALYSHFDRSFPYQEILEEYPLQKTPFLAETVKNLNLFTEV